jgi:hypothetical protein
MAYRVAAFTRKGGVKVKAHMREKPTLSPAERARRARVAKEELLPAGIKAAGQRGFRGTLEKLVGKPGIESPERLAGWLKGQAKERGELSPRHPYVGRRGYRKYKAAAKRMSKKEYTAYLRARRGKPKSRLEAVLRG